MASGGREPFYVAASLGFEPRKGFASRGRSFKWQTCSTSMSCTPLQITVRRRVSVLRLRLDLAEVIKPFSDGERA
jgi:hypothetical protein